MSYTYVIGRPCTENALAADKIWKFGRFGRDVWADLAIEGRRLMPDPIAVLGEEVFEKISLRDAEILRKIKIADQAERAAAKAEGRPPVVMAQEYSSVSRSIEERAYLSKSRYMSAGSPELSGFLLSNEGQSYLFYLLLKANHPEMTPDLAYEIYWDLNSNAGKDGRKTPDTVIQISMGRAAEPAKNAESPV